MTLMTIVWQPIWFRINEWFD